MKKILYTTIIILTSTFILRAQNVNKGFQYIEQKEYEKAIKIFNKAITTEKDYVAGKYGLALIYTDTDFSGYKFYNAYQYVSAAKNRFQKYSPNIKIQYFKNFGISEKSMDSISNFILESEYQKALSYERIDVWNNFISLYKDTPQAKQLETIRDSIIFENVKKDGSVYAYEKFLYDYEESSYADSARKHKDIQLKKEYDDAFKTLEFNAIKQFQSTYPQYPFYDDSTQFYINLAVKAANLKLFLGFMPANLTYYIDFINVAAPSEMAYQTLLCLIQPQIEEFKYNDAIDTVKKYKPLFNGYYKVDSLISILSRPAQNVQNFNLCAIINTKAYEYMPVVSADDSTIYFCGQERADNIGGEDIFVSYRKDNTWTQPHLIKSLSTSNKNEAPLAISPDENSMIMFSDGDVFVSDKTKTGWSYRQPISKINTKQNWEADAYYSPDGNAIFFSSDRPGGVGPYHKFSQVYHGDYIGNLDLYVIVKQDDGTWSDPINLGPVINTPYTERTPFLHPDMKTLYFSSDGHPGIGKLDVFKTTRLNDSSWTEWSTPVNLGKEINTPKKEYGYKISTDGTKAYYTKFLDNQSDLYFSTLPKSSRPDYVAIIKGFVTDQNHNPLQAEMIWENLVTLKKLGDLKTDPVTGEYTITLPLGKNYGFYVSKENYYPLSDNVDLTAYDQNITIRKDFQLISNQSIIDGDVAIELTNVFFDFDKFDLKSSSYPELNRLANFIKQYPDIKIEVSGHTDNVGSDSYNKNLSQKRSDAVKAYLISQGCNASQLTSVGYGFDKPVADNTTDEGRQKNRRVEFIVKK